MERMPWDPQCRHSSTQSGQNSPNPPPVFFPERHDGDVDRGGRVADLHFRPDLPERKQACRESCHELKSPDNFSPNQNRQMLRVRRTGVQLLAGLPAKLLGNVL